MKPSLKVDKNQWPFVQMLPWVEELERWKVTPIKKLEKLIRFPLFQRSNL